jgi:hypothetical protein
MTIAIMRRVLLDTARSARRIPLQHLTTHPISRIERTRHVETILTSIPTVQAITLLRLDRQL